MFLERLSIFDYSNNKYFKPKGTFNTRSATDSLAMPNCTAGAYFRAHEMMEATERVPGLATDGLGWHNAKTWYHESKFPKGSELRVGAIAVFDGNCGHVVTIERVIDKTHAIYTQSSYNADKSLRDWQFWSKRTAEFIVGKATISGCGKLLGFIYLPINDIRVGRDTAKEQLEIKEELVNVRTGAGLNKAAVSKGLYCPMGIFNILDKKVADGYTWCKLEDGCWVAHSDKWSVIYEAEEQGTVAELKAQIKELKEENKTLTAKTADLEKKNNSLEDILSKIKSLIDSIVKLFK